MGEAGVVERFENGGVVDGLGEQRVGE